MKKLWIFIHDPEKIKAITEFEIPKNLQKLQSFLGASNFLRKHVKDFAKISKPLKKLVRFEAKNGQIKSNKNNNFKNICKSVAERHEIWSLSKRFDMDWEEKENFFSAGITIKGKKLDKNLNYLKY